MITKIWVTAQFVGCHQWPKAPPLVAFLRNLHRHVFHVRALFRVTGDDRQLEFFTVQQNLEAAADTVKTQLQTNPYLSCEQMALSILTFLSGLKFWVESVEVSEDAENGAIVVKNDQEMRESLPAKV
jgi:hypothetical protein